MAADTDIARSLCTDVWHARCGRPATRFTLFYPTAHFFATGIPRIQSCAAADTVALCDSAGTYDIASRRPTLGRSTGIAHEPGTGSLPARVPQ